MARDKAARVVVDAAIFIIAALGTFIAQSVDRPITAVLIFQTALIAIAVHSGLRAALVAALAASLVYNLVLTGPVFAFRITSAEELVPLVAFIISAVIAGTLVGRLKDAAERAALSKTETAFLLTVSDRLQRAISVAQIESELQSVLPPQFASEVRIYIAKDGSYRRPANDETLDPPAGRNEIESASDLLFTLVGPQGDIGIVRFLDTVEAEAGQVPTVSSLSSIVSMLALAVDRCLLLEKVTETNATQRSEELKDTILSSISHDLRTPLTAIETAASALISSQVTLDKKDHDILVRSIVDQCHRLDRYTSELLDVGKIQSGISDSQFDSVELGEIVQSAINHARTAFPEAQVERELPRLPVFVIANAVMLEQAVSNVIENACKFGGDAGPVSIAMRRSDHAAVIEISDAGPGIAEADRSRIFERFFRGDKTRARHGSGLGLYVSRGFIEAFAGTIAASEATPKGGVTFSITLPLAQAPNALKVSS